MFPTIATTNIKPLAVLHLPDRGAHVPEHARVLRALLERTGHRLGDGLDKEDAEFEKGNRSSEGSHREEAYAARELRASLFTLWVDRIFKIRLIPVDLPWV